MAQQQAIVDKLLTGVSIGYVPKGYISEMILPKIGVVQSTGKIGQYSKSHLRIENSVQGGEGAYRRVEPITRTSQTYDIDGHGLEVVVTQKDYRNVEDPFNAERDKTLGVTTMLWNEKEKLLADTLASTGTMTQNTTLSGDTQLSDYDDSDPVSVFNTARAAVKAGCGLPPDTAILSWEVANKLRYHPQLLDLLGFKYAQPGGLSDMDLARVFDVQRVLIGMAMYNSAAEGQTATLANIWGKHIVLAVCPSSAIPFQVSLGYQIGYSGKASREVSKFPLNNPPGATGIVCEDNYDFLLSDVTAAYLIKDAVA